MLWYNVYPELLLKIFSLGQDVGVYRCFTLKADVFPVGPIARTVQPAANQTLVNGLEDTHVDCLAVVHLT